MSSHPIKGTTTLEVAGELRTLACDMNAAAVLFELKGDNWQDFLVNRFLGEKVEGGRKVTPLSPADSVEVLYALLASDREDHPRIETVKSLRRTLGLAELADLQLSLVRAVLAGFGLPGEFIEAVASAADAPRAHAAAAGTGTKP